MCSNVTCFECLVLRIMFENNEMKMECANSPNSPNFIYFENFICHECEMQLWHMVLNIHNLSYSTKHKYSLCFDFNYATFRPQDNNKNIMWKNQYGWFNTTKKNSKFFCTGCMAPNPDHLEL